MASCTVENFNTENIESYNGIASISVNPDAMATSVLTAHDLLQREIDDMRKDIKELQGEVLPENHERMRDVLEGSDFFDSDEMDDDSDELPTLRVEESDDDDFDQKIEELSDFMESMGIGPSVNTDDCEVVESDIPLE